jgi:hypothetical protein
VTRRRKSKLSAIAVAVDNGRVDPGACTIHTPAITLAFATKSYSILKM